jgi:bla regulator protein blaR1
MRRPTVLSIRSVSLLLAACTSLFASFATAQARAGVGDRTANAQAMRAHNPAFEVVSIKPGEPGDSNSFIWLPENGDEYRARNFPLYFTIEVAYLPYSLIRPQRLKGAPSWVWHDYYDFEAKVGGAELAEWQKLLRHQDPLINPMGRDEMLQEMLQRALTERCKLVVHRIQLEAPGYALVVDKHGPNWKELKESKLDEAIPPKAQRISENARLVPILSPDQPVLHYFHTSMAELAEHLSRRTPVEDRTGLTGEYDFSLLRLSTLGDPGVDWNLGALGLRLVRIKVPTETIVIDHIERPSPN